MSWPSIGEHASVYALVGAITIAFSSILVRLSDASASTAAIFRCVYALPILGLLAYREDRRLGGRAWRERRAGLAAGVFFAIDIMLWNHSIADVGAGLATVLANIQVVILPLVAWALLAERPGRAVLLALPVALFGVLLISGVLEHGAFGRDPTRGTLFGIGAGTAYVGFLLLLRRGGADLRRPAGPLFDATAVSAVLCVLAGLAIGDARFVPTWPSAGWLGLLALGSQVVGWLLIGAALPRLPAAMGSMLLTVQPIGSVALAALIFAESPSTLQLGGVALVLVALIVAGRGRRSETRLARGSRPGTLGIRVDGGEGGSDNVWSGDLPGAGESPRAGRGV
ncbi:MAG TPA: DMT family transporter [Solirubrobacteraceae bacterium]|nr:DMT family transporter [Solirubrobacteraceae bacterium]